MIELSHIIKEYGSAGHVLRAVDDVTLSIAEGEIFGIIGYSGAGKSTLVRCINLLERPTSPDAAGRSRRPKWGRQSRS